MIAWEKGGRPGIWPGKRVPDKHCPSLVLWGHCIEQSPHFPRGAVEEAWMREEERGTGNGLDATSSRLSTPSGSALNLTALPTFLTLSHPRFYAAYGIPWHGAGSLR